MAGGGMLQEILDEMKTVADGVVDAIVYPSITDKTKNRGFAFVEFESHRAAAMARRKLLPGRIQLWGQQVAVDWAEPEHDVDEDTMAKVSSAQTALISTFVCQKRDKLGKKQQKSGKETTNT